MSIFNKFINHISKKEKNELLAVVNGTILKLTEVNDEVFSTGMMGPGIAIQPSDGNYVAPADGEIIVIPESKHAIGMKLSGGIEVLIHIGLDTVMLKGQGFKPLVQVGQKVKKGDPIMKVDLDFFLEKKIDIVTPVIVLNSDDFELSILDEPRSSIVGETQLILYQILPMLKILLTSIFLRSILKLRKNN